MKALTILAIIALAVSACGQTPSQDVKAQGTPPTLSIPATLNFPNAGLSISDSNASHTITISTTSNVTANRTVFLNPGDANGTINWSGTVTLTADGLLPTQTGHAGEVLGTNGTIAAWQAPGLDPAGNYTLTGNWTFNTNPVKLRQDANPASADFNIFRFGLNTANSVVMRWDTSDQSLELWNETGAAFAKLHAQLNASHVTSGFLDVDYGGIPDPTGANNNDVIRLAGGVPSWSVDYFLYGIENTTGVTGPWSFVNTIHLGSNTALEPSPQVTRIFSIGANGDTGDEYAESDTPLGLYWVKPAPGQGYLQFRTVGGGVEVPFKTSQIVDSDLAAIAALTTHSFGRGLLEKDSGNPGANSVCTYIGAATLGDNTFNGQQIVYGTGNSAFMRTSDANSTVLSLVINNVAPTGYFILSTDDVTEEERFKVSAAGLVTAMGGFSGPGSGITAINAANIATNTLDNARLDTDVAALGDNATNGLWARTGAGTGAARTLTAPAAGITITNGNGVSGNPTLALANDLSALEGLSGTGLAVHTGSNAWSERTIAVTSTHAELTITNGNGVGGNPTLAIQRGGLINLNGGLLSSVDSPQVDDGYYGAYGWDYSLPANQLGAAGDKLIIYGSFDTNGLEDVVQMALRFNGNDIFNKPTTLTAGAWTFWVVMSKQGTDLYCYGMLMEGSGSFEVINQLIGTQDFTISNSLQFYMETLGNEPNTTYLRDLCCFFSNGL